MCLVLDPPTELETELTIEGVRFGLPPSEYVLRILTGERALRLAPRSGAELLAYWQSEGLIGTRSDIADSPAHACALRDQAQRRARS